MELSLTGREGLGRCDNYREVYEIREDLGACVSKIFRPDRQNGFISVTAAKSSRRHAEERSDEASSILLVVPQARHLP